MSEIIVCAVCGKENKANSKFCGKCGKPLGDAGQTAAEVEQATPAPQPAAPAPIPQPMAEAGAPLQACPSCGTPFVRPDQVFCTACGKTVSPTASAQPAQLAGGIGNIGGFAANGPAAAPAGNADLVSRFNQKMGTNVDLDSVGAGFVATDVRADQASEESLAAAFAEFGQALPPAVQPSASTVPDALVAHSRRDAAGSDSYEAASMGDFDTAARANGSERSISYGRFATSLSDQLVPSPEEVIDAATLDEARKRKHTDRLKTQVEMGDLSRNQAVQRQES